MKTRNLIILFLLSGILLLSIDFQKRIDVQLENDSLIKEYLGEETNKISNDKDETYMGILEIPKISLKQGFFAYQSPQNDVQKHLNLLSPDCNPTLPCSIIIASHSGNSAISYFKNLDQLNIGDIATITYEKQIFSYVLKKVDTMNKVGVFTALKPKESELILTTCDDKNDVQDLYYFELKKA